MGFLQDVTDALLGFVYDPPAHAGIEEFLGPLPGAELRAKRPRECVVNGGNDGPCVEFPAGARRAVVQQVLAPLPEAVIHFIPTQPTLPPVQQQPDAAFVRGSGAMEAKKGGAAAGDDERHHQAVQSAAARELSRLIPGATKLNSTAEMLQAAARHVRLLQALVGMLALMHSAGDVKVPFMAAAQEYQMHMLLASGGVQERLAGEGKSLVPTRLVHAIADDKAMIKSNPVLNRDLNRFMDSLEQ